MKLKLFLILLLALLLNACSEPDHPTISLYLAVQRGDIDQVERHLYWSSDINKPFPDGRYPLQDAAENGRIIMLKLLLKNGAKVDLTDASGQTALQLAVLAGRTRTAEELLKAGAHLDASALLLKAARAGVQDRDVVRFLNAHGADLDAGDKRGDTALIIATASGNNRLVHHLVEQGADVNRRNRDGVSAFDIAQRDGATNLQQFLLRNGATHSQ